MSKRKDEIIAIFAEMELAMDEAVNATDAIEGEEDLKNKIAETMALWKDAIELGRQRFIRPN